MCIFNTSTCSQTILYSCVQVVVEVQETTRGMPKRLGLVRKGEIRIMLIKRGFLSPVLLAGQKIEFLGNEFPVKADEHSLCCVSNIRGK